MHIALVIKITHMSENISTFFCFTRSNHNVCRPLTNCNPMAADTITLAVLPCLEPINWNTVTLHLQQQ